MEINSQKIWKDLWEYKDYFGENFVYVDMVFECIFFIKNQCLTRRLAINNNSQKFIEKYIKRADYKQVIKQLQTLDEGKNEVYSIDSLEKFINF